MKKQNSRFKAGGSRRPPAAPSGARKPSPGARNPSPGARRRPDRPAGPPQVRVPESRGMAPAAPAPDADAAPTDPDEDSAVMRLQKFLAMSGVDSRRNSEQYIRDGRVTVDGEVVTDPARSVHAETSDVRLDAERLRLPRFRYFLLHKPRGVLCTNRDPDGRPRAIDLIPVADQRLFTVGRLDENTSGLLLVTNDGDLAQRLAHPRFEVVRRYRCHVAGWPPPEVLTQLREAMYFAEGFFRFRGVRVVKHQGRSTVLELELQEGRNREIRRLLARVGHKVIELERIAFGPIVLGSLPYGRFRELHANEIRDLKRFLATGELAIQPRRGSFGYRPGKTRNKRRRTTPGGQPATAAGRTGPPQEHAAPGFRTSRGAGDEQSGTRRSRGAAAAEPPRGRRSAGPGRGAQGAGRGAQGPGRGAQASRGPRGQQAAGIKGRNRRRP
ncbi:MAG: pseudouridine synthase [Planctomyces sp.]